ncbi:MAG TPA: TIGR03905 family TSCPD domain-containing protein [Lachnospiraceae bacterium]|nr:TIGR03905 family TSCPD domain-containing protein [Lachnospiraceae bacterium]
MRFIPKGICAQAIDIELDQNIIKSVTFTGGCNGNHKGIGALVEGMDANDAIQKLSGITCGMRNTSCPDQLAVALQQMMSQQ